MRLLTALILSLGLSVAHAADAPKKAEQKPAATKQAPAKKAPVKKLKKKLNTSSVDKIGSGKPVK
jgi:hypothetical protein